MPLPVLIHPLPSLGVTRVMGRDARDYLNRRLCQKTLDIPVGHGRRAFLLDAVGKIQLDLEVYALADQLLLIAPANGRGEVIPQLERYVFTEDCTFADESDATSAFAILGPQGNEVLASLGIQIPAPHQIVVTDGVLVLSSDYALGELLLLVPTERAEDWKRRIAEAIAPFDGSFIASNEFESARILAGRPAWTVDVTPEEMPLDAPSLRHGVHFNKGCFPGQEALARVENLGHPAKCLIRLQSHAMPPAEGWSLLDESTGDRVGKLTSVAMGDAHIVVALGLVIWSAREAGRRFKCGEVLFESLGPVPATEALGR